MSKYAFTRHKLITFTLTGILTLASPSAFSDSAGWEITGSNSISMEKENGESLSVVMRCNEILHAYFLVHSIPLNDDKDGDSFSTNDFFSEEHSATAFQNNALRRNLFVDGYGHKQGAMEEEAFYKNGRLFFIQKLLDRAPVIDPSSETLAIDYYYNGDELPAGVTHADSWRSEFSLNKLGDLMFIQFPPQRGKSCKPHQQMK